MDTDNNKADIRCVHLCRKTIDEVGCETKGDNLGQQFFLTDYFDIMYVEKMQAGDGFAKMMGIYSEQNYGDEITVQSYTLYHSAEMSKRFEQTNSLNVLSYKGDAFDDSAKKYLGIIHVYITPEVLARVQIDEIDFFVKDLYNALDEFYQVMHHKIAFTARVYKMMSAGDFAVVVRSERPDTIYRIATFLRKRVLKGTQYVMYKTYTILALDKEAWKGNNDNKDCEVENLFAIRGCYSNKYWGRSADNKIIAMEKNLTNRLQRLNGRYDFSVQLNEKEFMELMPAIVKAKHGIIANATLSTDSELIKYIKILIKEGYLSYLNERYLMNNLKDLNLLEPTNKGLSEVAEQEVCGQKESIHDKNKKEIESLLKLYEEVNEEAQRITAYRKKIGYYLWLLRREIRMCQMMNEMSDVRINAAILLELLKTALKTAKVYIKTYSLSTRRERQTLDILEGGLCKAVTALDCYAGYVRNNNMQSRQTPNYHIESTVGMEKLVIGYSEYVWSMAHAYHNAGDKEYIMVVVPDLHDMEVNVEVLFPEGGTLEWETECQIRAEEWFDNKYLVIVGSATLTDLGNVPIMLAALAHEAAHLFRYEPRKERNQALMHTAVQRYMEEVARKLSAKINESLGEDAIAITELSGILTVSLTRAYEQSLDDMHKDKLLNMPLRIFWKMLEQDLQELISRWEKEEYLEQQIKDYIQELHFDTSMEAAKYRELLKAAIDILNDWETYQNGYESSYVRTEWEGDKKLEKINDWAFQMAWSVASDIYERDKKTSEMEVRENVDNKTWEELWLQEFQNPDEKCRKTLEHIWRQFERFSRCVEAYIDELNSANELRIDKGVVGPDRLAQFNDKLYREMSNEWKKHKNHTYRYWNRLGRYLGLSAEEPCVEDVRKFEKNIKHGSEEYDVNAVDYLIKLYREQTADLFMCRLLNLSEMAYLNLVIHLFAEKTVYEDYFAERVFGVLYINWCCEMGGNKEEARKKYEKLCRELVRKLERRSGYVEGKKSDDILKNIENAMNEICCKIEKTDNSQKKILEYTLRSYALIERLIDMADVFERKMSEEIRNDLLKGREILEKRCKEMKTKGIEGETLERATEIAQKLEEVETFEEDAATIAEDSMELILRMYYNNKMRNANTETKNGGGGDENRCERSR